MLPPQAFSNLFHYCIGSNQRARDTLILIAFVQPKEEIYLAFL
jgi:hypothetical protein